MFEGMLAHLVSLAVSLFSVALPAMASREDRQARGATLT
jgi:hypothetical protein